MLEDINQVEPKSNDQIDWEKILISSLLKELFLKNIGKTELKNIWFKALITDIENGFLPYRKPEFERLQWTIGRLKDHKRLTIAIQEFIKIYRESCWLEYDLLQKIHQSKQCIQITHDIILINNMYGPDINRTRKATLERLDGLLTEKESQRLVMYNHVYSFIELIRKYVRNINPN